MIIGLTGYKQSGKSVAADYLQSKYNFVGHNFKTALIKELKENFPDLLKAIVDNENGWNAANDDLGNKDENRKDWTIDQLFEEKPPLVRALMKNYGTEFRRKEDLMYWVTKWQLTLPSLVENNIVVDDVRFINDIQRVKQFGGKIIRIIKTGQINNDTHQTESEIDSITPDYTIQANEGDHESIYKQIDAIIDKLNK